MPNYAYNRLEIAGAKDEIRKVENFVIAEKGQTRFFSFDEEYRLRAEYCEIED